MGIFSRKKPVLKSEQSRRVQSNSPSHHAAWGTNGVTFFVRPEGVSFSYDREYNWMMDDMNTNAALAQLERAYHLNITFPEAEETIMSMWRDAGANISASMKPDFRWTPPLPNT